MEGNQSSALGKFQLTHMGVHARGDQPDEIVAWDQGGAAGGGMSQVHMEEI